MRQKSLLLAIAIGALALTGCAASHDAPPVTESPDVSQAALPAQDLKNTVCPVSGDKVGDSTNTVVYDGKVYHVCCPDCHKDFQKDPKKYAAAVAADPLKYGVTTQPS